MLEVQFISFQKFRMNNLNNANKREKKKTKPRRRRRRQIEIYLSKLTVRGTLQSGPFLPSGQSHEKSFP